MTGRIERRHADVLVVGGGAAGVTAALARNALGEPIVGGSLRELIEACRCLGGDLGPGFDTEVMV